MSAGSASGDHAALGISAKYDGIDVDEDFITQASMQENYNLNS